MKQREVVVVNRRDWSVARRFATVREAAAFAGLDVPTVYWRCYQRAIDRDSLYTHRFPEACDLEGEPFERYLVELEDVDGTRMLFPSPHSAARRIGVSCSAVSHARHTGTVGYGRYRVRYIREGSYRD